MTSRAGHHPSLRALLTALAVAVIAAVSASPASPAVAAEEVAVIVRAAPGAGPAPQQAVRRLGGEVVRDLGLINGFSARLPRTAVPQLSRVPGVLFVTPDASIEVHSAVDDYDAGKEVGSLNNTARLTKARDLRLAGYTGAGIDVALIDTGVTATQNLLPADRIVNGPDFSYESGAANLRHRDNYGHGVHMAGIIAAGDASTAPVDSATTTGIAPGARIVNVKVGGWSGATDVSQVIAALDWVVQNRRTDGLNIRIVNMAFGTNGTQNHQLDPLSYAAEVAWRKGVVVVVAAGNAGKSSGQLSNPAYNPYVLAVGASDTKGTMGLADDVIPTWSSHGDGVRNPDVVAPGKSIGSVRAPGSHIDTVYPESIINARLTRGSGTSQAAAVVSGGVALLLEKNPSLTPDQIKHVLRSSARTMPNADSRGQGAGLVDFAAASKVDATKASAQTWPVSTGSGSLDAARGDQFVVADGVPLTGEQTVWGGTWDSAAWAADMWNETSWTGDAWSGDGWTGTSWSGSSWSGSSWSGSSWSGSSWSGSSWSGSSWSGSSWSTGAWLGASWG